MFYAKYTLWSPSRFVHNLILKTIMKIILRLDNWRLNEYEFKEYIVLA